MTAFEDIMRQNPWQLYQSVPGWEDCAQRLDFAMEAALKDMDYQVSLGESVKNAALAAYERVVRTMDNDLNAGYGAGDTEPRAHLTNAIRRHIKTKYATSVGTF